MGAAATSRPKQLYLSSDDAQAAALTAMCDDYFTQLDQSLSCRATGPDAFAHLLNLRLLSSGLDRTFVTVQGIGRNSF